MRLRRDLAAFFCLCAAILLLAVCIRGPHEASAQRQAPTWIGPPAPVGINTPQPTTLPPNVLASMLVTPFYVDPQNATTCASDSNATCTQSGCGTAGDGPCRTYTQLATRWGTYCPRLTGGTTYAIHFLSGHTTNADPVPLCPTLEGGSSLVVDGPLGASQQVASGTFTSLVAKNRATPQLLKVGIAADAGTVATGELIQNTTHASYAWIYESGGGTTWLVTQPIAAITPPTLAVLSPPTEVNTWTSGDSFVVYRPIVVNVTRCKSVLANWNAGLTNGVFLQHLNVASPTDTTMGPVHMGDNCALVESRSQRDPTFDISQINAYAQALNVYSDLGAMAEGSGPASSSYFIFGGTVGAQGGTGTINSGTFVLDGDVILAGSANTYSVTGSELGTVYVDTGASLALYAGVTIVNGGLAGTGIVWGPGSVNVTGGARLAYPSGDAGARTALPVTTLQIDGQGKACLSYPASAATTVSCNLSVTATQLDTSLGGAGVTGCLVEWGGGAYCNGGTL